MPNSFFKTAVFLGRYFYWWPVLILAWCLAKLPRPLLLRLGKDIGRLMNYFPTTMRHVAQVNIAHCFPALSSTEQKTLIKKSLESTGMGMIELLICWFGHPCSSQNVLDITPSFDAQIINALTKGRGVILLCPHITSLHMIGALLSQKYTYDVIYNKIKHPLFEYFNRRHLNKYYAYVYPRENIRQAIKALKKNHILFYTPDIDPVQHGGIFAPFFGVNAYTLTATAKIAAITNTTILPCYLFRKTDGSGYIIDAAHVVNDFPSSDPLRDATVINGEIEKIILKHPEQYMWTYKRFKTRPAGEKSFY